MLLKKPPFKKILNDIDSKKGVTLADILINAIVMEAVQKNGKIKFRTSQYGRFI